NEHIVQAASNPAGATSAVFRFGMTNAGNNWWWAIDNVRAKFDKTNPTGANLTAAVATGPSHGALTLNPNGSFTYTATAGYTGADSFTYTATDGIATSAPATVSIQVYANNATPVANADAYTVKQGATLTANGVAV